MKTADELKALKDEVETLNKKLAELGEDDLKQVVGGSTSEALQRYNDELQRYISGTINPETAYYSH